MLSWLVISKLIDAYESIYHILPAGKEEGRVQHVLMAEGESVLPGYIGFLSTLVDTYEKLITNIAAVDILLGLSICMMLQIKQKKIIGRKLEQKIKLWHKECCAAVDMPIPEKLMISITDPLKQVNYRRVLGACTENQMVFFFRAWTKGMVGNQWQ